ncbi:hypothetical protein SUDANB105_08198 (plasmid) [Streptomyces sp. enrichment culture]|uniref:hypothetical protein n=1 Tax=Streptomyces sp. enrichment culture TaxID=1795815 RepID=UPI003F55D8B7
MSGTMTPPAATEPHADHSLGVLLHGIDSSACANSGMQHCTAANVGTVKLPVPPPGHAEAPESPHLAQPDPLPARTVSRAPPDLAVLSQLRI